MDTDLALNAASALKERFFLTDQGAIAIWQEIERVTSCNKMLTLLVKIANGRERDWGYEKPEKEMITQACELLSGMGIEWRGA